MKQDILNDTRIDGENTLSTPDEIKLALPATPEVTKHIHAARSTIENILDKEDGRIIVIAGPCSIHDIAAAKEYAHKLKALHDQYIDKLFIVMRVYFEKPRTTVGWKGFLNDPYLNDSFDVESGLRKGRELLLWLAELGLPAGTEALDPITPQYLSDLFSWSAIGARTTESQTHRELASGLSMPVGFKNGTDGNLEVAMNAMQSSASPHRFIGINEQGQVSLVHTTGNPYGHVILRGGKTPNYEAEHIENCRAKLEAAGLSSNFIVDCSHGNSQKKYQNQGPVFKNVIDQIVAGNKNIIGLMLESHLHEGNQPITPDPKDLKYGVSITDACIDWQNTADLLEYAYGKLNA